MIIRMENLDLNFVKVRTKAICSREVLRLIVNLTNATISESDIASLESWFQQFYRYVESTNTRFCVIYVFDTTFDNADAIQRMSSMLNTMRDVTQRLSVTTCVVAPPFLSFVAQMAMHVYSTKGRVHFVDTLEDAKQTCVEEARR